MLMMSKEDLQKEAKNKGYRPGILEKVYRLLDLLEQFLGISYLKNRLVLKGGTAINLFCIDTLHRLSVDLDFNYIGSTNRETMREEKVQLEAMIVDTCKRRKYELDRSARAHAGGKMIFMYPAVISCQDINQLRKRRLTLGVDALLENILSRNILYIFPLAKKILN